MISDSNHGRWLQVCSLLAGAAGYMHDIGKANIRFQKKISGHGAVRDAVRHEWLSAKVMHLMRDGKSWEDAWTTIRSSGANGLRQFPAIASGVGFHPEQDVSSAHGAVDFIVMTHHGLFDSAMENELGHPSSSRFVTRDSTPEALEENLTPQGDLPDALFQQWRSAEQQLETLGAAGCDGQFWKAATIISRIAMIFADHTISQTKMASPTPFDGKTLYANSWGEEAPGCANQTLDWHLSEVGRRAAETIPRLFALEPELSFLSQNALDKIRAPSDPGSRFHWQNTASDALAVLRARSASPVLVMNTAGTGAGKTRMNLRACATLRNENVRVAIALNLKSLTLQTGRALTSSFGMGEDELSTVLGDRAATALFNHFDGEDEDGNETQSEYVAHGKSNALPDWLDPFFANRQKQKTVLASPLLVSTIDYLIQAGQPGDQGHFIRSALRVMTSDLILDEVDSYEPPALVAVLRVVQMAALFGRNVICSSATLSMPVAIALESAFRSGITMRKGLLQQEFNGSFHIAIIDNLQQPFIFDGRAGHDLTQAMSFRNEYKKRIQTLAKELKSGVPNRLAKIAGMAQQTVSCWLQTVQTAVEQLHQLHHTTGPDGQRLSIGLIRVANVHHAQRAARHLRANRPEWKVACYHADDLVLNRAMKEQRLDALLSRQKGDAHLFEDQEILGFFSNGAQDVTMIVIATPVEEIGRDHDFDWGVIDLSSTGSLVQCAGRINRHRLVHVTTPNIMIPQFNFKACTNHDAGKADAPCFLRPGYETEKKGTGSGFRPNTAYMLGTSTSAKGAQTVVERSGDDIFSIDARLRFAKVPLRQCDDAAIKSFLEQYFWDDKSIFSGNGSLAYTRPAYLHTRLRDQDPKVDGYYDYSAGAFYETRQYEDMRRDVRSGIVWDSKQPGGWLSYSEKELDALEKEFDSLRLSTFSLSAFKKSDRYTSWLGFERTAS